MKIDHPLWQTLRSLKGNQRACVVAEPLWAIPVYLYIPFASMYMAAIGLLDLHIGVVTSVGLAVQFLASLFSGAIVDKYGRCKSMLIFGLLSWALPCLLWAGAQSYWYFIVAAAFNGIWRVSSNSHSCLIIEDGETGHLINIYTIFSLISLIAGFMSPVMGIFIERFTLVPTMRVMYLVALIMMTIKFVLQYRLMDESKIGLQKREESKGLSLFSITFGGFGNFLDTLKKTKLILYVILMALITCFNTVQSTFWPLFVKAFYGVNDSLFSLFPMVKAVITIFAHLFITSKISLNKTRHPLLLGLGAQFLGLTVLLICLPYAETGILAVFFSAICEAFAFAIILPTSESMISVAIPDNERARIISFITSMIVLISIPVGWIAGRLSQLNRMFPLILNLCFLIAEALMVLIITKVQSNKKDVRFR